MAYNFDDLIERRSTDSIKWRHFAEDVIPMWVADMDFRSPEPVIQALHERIEHGVFGYGDASDALRAVICERLLRLYQWRSSRSISSFCRIWSMACSSPAKLSARPMSVFSSDAGLRPVSDGA